MKHNNVIPNAHFHKDWKRRVKVWLNQAKRKETRRSRRDAKAARVFPRPTAGLLRPVVHPPTVRYNMKIRAGRGFTLQELAAAGLNRNYAQTIGVCVDHRRKNRCVESLQANVQRLKEYMNKIYVYPKDSKGLTQPDYQQVKGMILPIVQEKKKLEVKALTPELKDFKAYYTLRKARADERLFGLRKKRAADKAASAASAK